jgi:hypothetical protein
MEVARCKKCGRPLRDPASDALGMGPECAGSRGGRKKYYSRRKVHSGSAYSLGAEGTASLRLFTLFQKEEDVLSAPDSPMSASGAPREEIRCPRN